MTIAAIRSAIVYSQKAYNAGDAGALYKAAAAEYWAKIRFAAGYISEQKWITAEKMTTLVALSFDDLGKEVPCQLKGFLEEGYAELGITCAMMGTLKDADLDCLKT